MTFREKLQQEHPKQVSADYIGGCARCPSYYSYEDDWNCTGDDITCRECWDREMEKED